MTAISLKLHLPEDVIEKYEESGPLEKVLADRLIKTADYTATRPIYINDYLRQRLERLFGRNFATPEELIKTFEKYVTARIENVDVALPPALLQRLKTRCFSNKPFNIFLSEQVVKGLEEYVGMR
jgi:hypothetical protein